MTLKKLYLYFLTNASNSQNVANTLKKEHNLRTSSMSTAILYKICPFDTWKHLLLLLMIRETFGCISSYTLQRHFCRVLRNTEVGAKCDFWVNTRFGILVKGSCIWANQVWPRAILTPSKWQKFKNVLAKSHKGDLPTGWDVFWLKAI